jgi:AhpD family alkylhydroperoxidase
MALPHREQPRVAPVEEPDPDVADLLSRTLADERGRPLTIFRTMARHPRMLKRFNVFAGFFLTRGVLPARSREIVVLRTAWRTDCRYEWGQHVLIGREAGLTDEEIARLAQPDHDERTPDGLLVRLVDELVDHDDVIDPTWTAVTEEHSVEEALELVMLVGLYRMVAGFLNTTGVQPEPHLPDWPDDASQAPARTPLSTTREPT